MHADAGWIDGRNVRMHLRWGAGDANRMRALAQELVGLQPDIIMTGSTAATDALQRETQTIPIVGVSIIFTGFVAAFNRPGGNITGFVNYEPGLGGKWLELLSEIAPGLKRAAISSIPTRLPHRLLCLHLRQCTPNEINDSGRNIGFLATIWQRPARA